MDLVDLKRKKKISSFFRHTDDIICVKISSDMKIVFSGALDNKIYMWSVEKRNILQEFDVEGKFVE